MEPSNDYPMQIFFGFLAGLLVWLVAFAFQFFMALSVPSELVFAICPVITATIAAYYFRQRHTRPYFAKGMLVALSLAFLVSSACGIQIASHGLGG